MNRSTPSSRTSPAAWAGSSASSRSSSSTPVAGGQRGDVELPADDRRGRAAPSASRSGSRSSRRPSTSLHGGRRIVSAQQRAEVGAARRRAGRTRRGRTGCRRCARRSVAVGRPTGRPRVTADDHAPRPPAAVEPGELEPQRVPARQRLGDVGQRAGRLRVARQVATTSSRSRRPRSRPAAAAPAASTCRPSAGRRARRVSGWSRPRPRTGCARSAPRTGTRRPRPSSASACRRAGSVPEPSKHRAHGHSGGAPSSCEQRPTSTACAARPGQRRELGGQPALADAGSPVSTANAGCPCRTRGRARRAAAASSSSRPTSGHGDGGPTGLGAEPRRPARARPAPAVGAGAAGAAPAAGGAQASAGSWRSTAVLQVAQLGAGVEAELVGEHLADLREHLERVGLAPDGPAPAPAAPTAARAAGARRSAPRARRPGGVVAEREPGHGPVLQRDQAQLLEAGPLGHGGGRVPELGVRRPAPQRRAPRRAARPRRLERRRAPAAPGPSSGTGCSRRCSAVTACSNARARRAPPAGSRSA